MQVSFVLAQQLQNLPQHLQLSRLPALGLSLKAAAARFIDELQNLRCTGMISSSLAFCLHKLRSYSAATLQ